MPLSSSPLVSGDLVWEIVRNNNAYLAKSKTSGGIQFSRDPLNPMNKNSRKYAGFVNDKAIGVVPGENGGVKVLSKNINKTQNPAKALESVTFSQNKSSRKTSKAVADKTAKNNYRADLRELAVARVSAIKQSQKEVKATPEKKPRGKKAKKAAEQA